MQRHIAETIARSQGLSPASLGLRFDRVALRVLDTLERFATEETPAATTVLLTITAPIRLPGKTVADLEREIATAVAGGVTAGDRLSILHGNDLRLRLARSTAQDAPRLLGFVHNRSTDAAQLLDLAEAWLRAGA